MQKKAIDNAKPERDENQGDNFGNPVDREWLLVKCERPFESTTDVDPGQEAHLPMTLDVTMAGASKYWCRCHQGEPSAHR